MKWRIFYSLKIFLDVCGKVSTKNYHIYKGKFSNFRIM
jgi:hypothetical protein